MPLLLQLKKTAAFLGALLLFAPVFSQAEDIDTDVHSILLLNKAVNKHRHQTNRPGPDSHSAKLRSYRNSQVAAQQQPEGGGVSLGNIFPAPGTNRPHSTTVIVEGHIIVTGK